MRDLDWYFDRPPFGVPDDERRARLLADLADLTDFHAARVPAFRRIAEQLHGWDGDSPPDSLSQLPFVPADLFKTHRLQSVSDDDVFKVLESSGTSSQTPSRIPLDRRTAKLQRRALATILTDFVGTARRPMLIVDSRSTLQRDDEHSARAAGIVGMMNFGRDHTFLLDDEMNLDWGRLESFAASHDEEGVLVFGFTYMIWKHLVRELERRGVHVEFPEGTVVHSGGWKALEEESVSDGAFRKGLTERTGIDSIHNFYGMVEQVGSVYVECDEGYFHASSFSDVRTRDPRDWSACADGTEGLIQTLSVLPRSYPGHSLLTEDLGVVHGSDDCPCGRLGTRFTVHGRVETAQLRGCSDVHAAESSA